MLQHRKRFAGVLRANNTVPTEHTDVMPAERAEMQAFPSTFAPEIFQAHTVASLLGN